MMPLNQPTIHHWMQIMPKLLQRHLHHFEDSVSEVFFLFFFLSSLNPFECAQTTHNSNTSPWTSFQENLNYLMTWIWNSSLFLSFSFDFPQTMRASLAISEDLLHISFDKSEATTSSILKVVIVLPMAITKWSHVLGKEHNNNIQCSSSLMVTPTHFR